MKHAERNAVDELRAMSAQVGAPIAQHAAEQLIHYIELVRATNETLNLTRIVDDAAAIRLHLVDSLSAVPDLAQCPDGPLLDLGTGGGFPGLPLALASGRSAVLLDSTSKKADAVSEMVAALGVDRSIEVIAARAEEYACRRRQTFAAVTARAVSTLPSLVELAAPFLQPEGQLIALKGSPTQEEIAAGRRAAAIVGLSEVGSRELVLPGGNERRTIVSYRRTGDSSIALPRRNGLAQHCPLA